MKPWYFAFFTTLFLVMSSPSQGAAVILNESNAVGSSRWLDEDGLDGSDKVDSQFGRILGNGGNWFELAVVGDGTAGNSVDMRGWKLSWTEEADVGEVVLSDDAFWGSVPAGTLLTFAELESVSGQDGSEIINGSDTSLDFASGDHWAHIYTADSLLIATTDTNVADNLDTDGNAIFGAFSVGNDDWQLTIFDDSMTSIFGPIGEGAPGVDAGVGSREVLKLEADIGTTIDAALYNDGSSSTFGQPNVWTDDMDLLRTQDFSSFGIVPEASSIVSLFFAGGLIGLFGRHRRS